MHKIANGETNATSCCKLQMTKKKKFMTNTFQCAFSIVKGKHKEEMRLGHLGKLPSFVLVELF